MTELRKVFGFTKSEMDCVQHRLDVPDAIADYLMETYGYSEDDIGEVTNALGCGKWQAAVDYNREIAAAAIRDAIEGSTWLGCVIGQGTKSQERKAWKDMAGAGAKIHAVIGGDELSIPQA